MSDAPRAQEFLEQPTATNRCSRFVWAMVVITIVALLLLCAALIVIAARGAP